MLSQLFKKRKTPNLSSVIVNQSALDKGGAYLVMSVVDFVNFSIDHGLYSSEEISSSALRSYSADYYLSQVNNGGHSQFIGNSGKALLETVNNAEKGLASMGAVDHLAILKEMLDWMAKHPEEASRQTGFGEGQSEFLDQLDSQFYALERRTPLVGMHEPWILSWPELRIVPDLEYSTELKRYAEGNPNLKKREIKKQISAIRQFTDANSTKMPIAMTGCKCQPVEFVSGVYPGSMLELENEIVPVFRVPTSSGNRLSVLARTWVGLFEAKAVQSDSSQSSSNMLGDCIGRVELEDVKIISQIANETMAAEAIFFILTSMNKPTENVYVAALEHGKTDLGNCVSWLVLTSDNNAYIAVTTEKGVLLSTQGDGIHLGKLSMKEIADRTKKLDD